MRCFRWLLLPLLLLALPGCSSVFYYPDPYLYFPPEDYQLKPQEVVFPANDGTKLYGWFFKTAKPAKGTVVLFHGNGQNMTSHYQYLAWLIDEGYNLFAFDYRGYGVSEGKPDQKGTYLDGLAALDKAYELHSKIRYPKKSIFVVYGQSIGGIISARSLADSPVKRKTDLLVIDSSFMSYKKIAVRTLAKFWYFWPFSWLGYFLVSNEYGIEDVLEKNPTRLLVIHDQKDPIVGFQNGREVFETAAGKKTFWTFDQGRHTGAFGRGNGYYQEEFLRLLDGLQAKDT